MVSLERQLLDREVQMWQRLEEYLNTAPSDGMVRTQEISDRAGLHPQQGRQIVRTWANDGLVKLAGDATQFWITEAGRQHEMPDE